MKKFIPRSFFNPTSFVGVTIAIVSFGLILFLFLLELFAVRQNPYMGIIAFVILPAFLLLGLAVAIVGMVLERKREHVTEGRFPHRPQRPSPALDDRFLFRPSCLSSPLFCVWKLSGVRIH